MEVRQQSFTKLPNGIKGRPWFLKQFNLENLCMNLEFFVSGIVQ